MKALTKKTILVTGVLNNRSIAFAISQAVLEAGGKLILTYQTSDKLRDKVTKLADEELAGAPTYPLDVGSDEQCDELFASIKRDFGKLDGLVHSIAFAERAMLKGKYHEVTMRDGFAQALDISAYSFTALASRAAPLMSDGGALLTLTYIGSRLSVPNYNVMGPAKAALESSVRYLAESLGGDNIRVNSISAGPIKTLAASGINGLSKMLASVAKQAPLRRNIDAKEVASAATFLLSDAASGITGEILHVDAGQHIAAGVDLG